MKMVVYLTAAICINGKQTFRYDKVLLPTYDVFDEDRYFFPGKELGLFNIDIDDQKIVVGLQICEIFGMRNMNVKFLMSYQNLAHHLL